MISKKTIILWKVLFWFFFICAIIFLLASLPLTALNPVFGAISAAFGVFSLFWAIEIRITIKGKRPLVDILGNDELTCPKCGRVYLRRHGCPKCRKEREEKFNKRIDRFEKQLDRALDRFEAALVLLCEIGNNRPTHTKHYSYKPKKKPDTKSSDDDDEDNYDYVAHVSAGHDEVDGYCVDCDLDVDDLME